MEDGKVYYFKFQQRIATMCNECNLKRKTWPSIIIHFSPKARTKNKLDNVMSMVILTLKTIAKE